MNKKSLKFFVFLSLVLPNFLYAQEIGSYEFAHQSGYFKSLKYLEPLQDKKSRSGLTMGLYVNTPFIVSGSVGATFGQKSFLRSWLVEVEPGLGGIRASIGRGLFFRGEVTWLGLAIKGSVLRSWGNPWTIEPWQTYLGFSGEITLVSLNINAGALFQATGDDAEKAPFFTFGVGIKY